MISPLQAFYFRRIEPALLNNRCLKLIGGVGVGDEREALFNARACHVKQTAGPVDAYFFSLGGLFPVTICERLRAEEFTRSGPLLAAALVVALFALPGCAQETGSEPAASPADATSTPPPEEVAPHEMTCAEIRDIFGTEEHEEEASYLVVWAYGVRTGVKGLDFEKHPVTKAGSRTLSPA